MMLRPSARALLALAALTCPTAALASPLNPWGAHVGKGVFALTPFLFADQGPAAYPYVYGQYGVSERFELLAGAGGTLASASSFDDVELMPRFFFSDSSGVALHATWVPGEEAVTLAPEYHGIYELDPLMLTVNVGWGPSVGSGFAAGPVYALIAPEWYFTESSSLFLELDPSYDLTDYGGGDVDRFYMEVVPGISTAIADTHYFAFGVAAPVTGFTTDAIYFGMWYSVAFGGT